MKNTLRLMLSLVVWIRERYLHLLRRYRRLFVLVCVILFSCFLFCGFNSGLSLDIMCGMLYISFLGSGASGCNVPPLPS